MADMGMKKKIGVQWKLDEHCISGLGWQQGEKACYQANVEVELCSIQTVKKLF